MFQALMEFLTANWQSVAIVVVFIIGLIVLYLKGYKSEVALGCIRLIAIAEEKFAYKDNETKLMYVYDHIYSKLPKIVKFFVSKDMLIKFIRDIVEDTKEWLQKQVEN